MLTPLEAFLWPSVSSGVLLKVQACFFFGPYSIQRTTCAQSFQQFVPSFLDMAPLISR